MQQQVLHYQLLQSPWNINIYITLEVVNMIICVVITLQLSSMVADQLMSAWRHSVAELLLNFIWRIMGWLLGVLRSRWKQGTEETQLQTRPWKFNNMAQIPFDCVIKPIIISLRHHILFTWWTSWTCLVCTPVLLTSQSSFLTIIDSDGDRTAFWSRSGLAATTRGCCWELINWSCTEDLFFFIY